MRNPLKTKKGDWSYPRIAITIIVSLLLLFTAILGIRTVPSGYIGVSTQFGQITGTTGEGIHWVNPWFGQDIVNIDLQIHKAELANLSCGTNDLQEVTTTVSINYKVEAGFAEDIFRTLRTDWESRVIINNMQESLKGSISNFKAEDLLQKREAVKILFLDTLRSRIDQYHITVIDVQLEDFQFSAKFHEAIENKATAEQKAQEEKNNLEIVRYQQEQEILKQQAQANMTRISADAYAYATLAKANADAEALQLIAQQLNVSPEYLEYLYLQRWDGQLPTYYGSGIIPFFQIPNNSTSTGNSTSTSP
jgi:regulator of protease activity HflC (stomatin/prohibitin superfamily)